MKGISGSPVWISAYEGEQMLVSVASAAGLSESIATPIPEKKYDDSGQMISLGYEQVSATNDEYWLRVV